MKNPGDWKPSKYVVRRGRLRASRDPREVSPASRLSADLAAALYERHIPGSARGRLLDLGCGKVPLHGVYAPHVSSSTCVDWPGTTHGNPCIDEYCDLSEPLPFGDGLFDTVILSDVLEHIPEPGRLWGEISRVLAPGGRVLANTPFLYWIHEQPHDYFRYTEHALRRFVERSGLVLVSLEATGGALEVMADIAAKNAMRIPLAGRPLAGLLQLAAAALLGTGPGRRLARSTGRLFPLGYFLVAEKPSGPDAPDGRPPKGPAAGGPGNRP